MTGAIGAARACAAREHASRNAPLTRVSPSSYVHPAPTRPAKYWHIETLPVSLGYEPYDMCLWRLGQSLAGVVTSADRADPISLRRLRLPRLGQSRRVRFTNRFTAQPLDLRFMGLPRRPCGFYPAAEIMSRRGGRRASPLIRRQADPDRGERQRPRTGSGAAA